MVSKETILYEYEEILLGKRHAFGCALDGNERERNRAIQIIWRFAIERLLGWTPQDALNYMNIKLVRRLNLEPTIKVTEFPPECKPTQDFSYILSIVYPNEIEYDSKEQCIHEYEKVMGIASDIRSNETYAFRKNYFDGPEGVKHADIILRHIISGKFNSISEAYYFFNSSGISSFLEKNHVLQACRLIYESPLEYLHYALPISQRDDFLYHYLLFMNDYKK